MARKKAYEINIKRLEEITGKIEQGAQDLDKTVELFEEGMALSRECHDFLNNAELKINKLLGDDGTETGDFEPE